LPPSSTRSPISVRSGHWLGAVTIGFRPVSTHYFDFHHSARDRLETVNPDDLEEGAAAMATLAYLLAEQGV
jgi:carboxypeptidase Q